MERRSFVGGAGLAGILAAGVAPAAEPLVKQDLLALPLREAREAFERIYFEQLLGREQANMSKVAEKAGLERTHLYRKLKQLNIRFSRRIDDGSGGGVAGDMIQNGTERVIQTRQLPAGVSVPLNELTLANNRMRFNSRGLAPDIVGAELIPLVNSTGQVL